MKLRLAAAGVWLALTVLGALNHTLIPGLLAPTGLYDVFPNLRYGYVMFNKNPTEVPIISYRREDGTWGPADELVATPAPFYKTTRMSVNLWIDQRYLAYLCRRQPLPETTFRVEFYRTPGRHVIDSRLLACAHGELRGL